jgi:hypothetical protein
LLRPGKTQASEIVSAKNSGIYCHLTPQVKYGVVSSKVICKWPLVTIALVTTVLVTTALVTTALEIAVQVTTALVTTALVTTALVTTALVTTALVIVALETGVKARP